MIQQITKGIHIGVNSKFEGTFFRSEALFYAFSYQITIENRSQETVQLLSRRWHILDALNSADIVEGQGVVGQQPILLPLQRHTYQSGCYLRAPFGAMKGHYNMISLSNQKTFTAIIPNFRLQATFAQN